MKHFITAAVMAVMCAVGQARETITIIYGWSLGDSIANYHRTLAAEANRIQDRWTFVVDARPGAGGSIAANHVLATPKTILGHSTAFFLRPNLYPNESHDIRQFREQFVHCSSPIAISSTRYRNWSELPKDTTATVGVAGLGIITHMASLQMKNLYPNITIVPFKSTNESMLSMISGNTDFHIGFISEAEQWTKTDQIRDGRRVTILGISGTRVVNGYQPLVKQGFPDTFASLNIIHHLLVPARSDDATTREWYDIFARAAQAPSVRAAYGIDYCEPQTVRWEELPRFFAFHTDFWRRLSAGVRLENASPTK